MQGRRWPGAVGHSCIVPYRARSPVWRPSAKHAQIPQPSPHRAYFRTFSSSGISDLWMPMAARVPSKAARMARRVPGVMSPAA
jgi:hypothetical protein